MPIHSFEIYDLESEEVCKFILNSGATNLTLHSDKDDQFLGNGYVKADERILEAGRFEHNFARTKTTTWRKLKLPDHRPIHKLNSTQVTKMECTAVPLIVVYLRSDLSQEIKDIAKAELANFDPVKLGDIGLPYLAEIEQSLLSNGLNVYDYQVFTTLALRRISESVILDTEGLLQSTVRPEGSEEPYILDKVAEKIDCHGAPEQSQEHTVIVDDVDDHGEVAFNIEDAMTKNILAPMDCG